MLRRDFIVFALCALHMTLCSAVFSVENSVTFSWSGGSGAWNDPANWSADDGSSNAYPNDGVLHSAVFPEGVDAVVAIPSGGIAVSNLVILAKDSNVTFRSPLGETNSITYRATGKHLLKCGANARLTLDAVRLSLMDAKGNVGRLFTAATNIDDQRFSDLGENTSTTLRNGSYISAINMKGRQCTWDIESGSECHVTDMTLASGSTMTLSNGYCTVWFLTGAETLDDGAKIVFKGETPRLVFGRISGTNLLNTVWSSNQGKHVPSAMRMEFHLPVTPYEAAPIGTNPAGSETFPGGKFDLADSGEMGNDRNVTFNAGNVAMSIAGSSPVRGVRFGGKRAFRLLDWSGMSHHEKPLGIRHDDGLILEGLKAEACETLYVEALEGWEDSGLPQILGVNVGIPTGLRLVLR